MEVKEYIYNKYPKDWKLIPLRKISTMNGRIGWQGLKQSEFTMNPDEPFLITGENFKESKIRWNEVYHIPNQRYEEAKPIQLKIGDVLMTKDGTIGKILFVDYIPYPGKASLNSHLLVFRPINGSYNPKFIFYQLVSKKFKDHIELEKSGTTFFGITQEAVGKYEAYLPEIAEQTAIAQVLSDTDELISSLEKLIEKKKLIKQGTMQQLLTGKKRLPGFSGEWQPIILSDVIDQFIVPMRDKPKRFEGDIPWCRIEDFTGKYLFGTKSGQYVNNEIISEMNLKVHPLNTLLVSCSADLGRCAIVKVPLVTNQTFIGLVSLRDKISIEFLFYFMTFNSEMLNQLSSGTTISYLSREQFESLQIIIPEDVLEQNKISELLSEMDSEIKSLEQKLNKYKSIKQGMMQNLLTGKIRLV